MQVLVTLNSTDFNLVWINIGNHGSMYVPMYEMTYGNVMKMKRLPESYSRVHQSVQLRRVHWKLLDRESHHCQENPKGQANLVTCIDEYIERRVGCSSKLQISPKKMQVCSTHNQYRMWAEVIQQVITLGENEIFSLTGCMGPCEMFDYGDTTILELQPDTMGDLAKGEKSLTLHIFFESGGYEAKEQYYVYDMNNLIADIGGYLGLLLGHSVFSLFCIMREAGAKFKTKML